MQPALKAALEDSAKANARSLNAEIVARLEDSLSSNAQPDALLLAARLQAELAEARYREHIRLVERQSIIDCVQELMQAIESLGVAEKVEEITFGYQELDRLSKEPTYSADYLQQLAKERETELSRAREAMDAALAQISSRAKK